MKRIDNQADAVKILEAIENKYGIFFRVHEKRIADFFELNFNPYATLKQKVDIKIPFTLMNDLSEEFDLVKP